MTWSDAAREAALEARRMHAGKGQDSAGARAKEYARRYQENPSDSSARAGLTRLAKSTNAYHPGDALLHRAGALREGGQSFSKVRSVAERNLAVGGKSQVHSLALTPKTPAVDLNKLNPGSRYSHEREVFVVLRKGK